MEIVRLSKTTLVAAASFFFALVVFDNTTDYDSNYEFVHHVLAMDDTFPGNHLMWRSIQIPPVYHIFYAGIITWELLCACTCAYGAVRMAVTFRASELAFFKAKQIATLGLTMGLMLWMIAFLCVGGEWFVMWQSHHWNGQDAAFRMFGVDALILIFLSQPESPRPPAAAQS